MILSSAQSSSLRVGGLDIAAYRAELEAWGQQVRRWRPVELVPSPREEFARRSLIFHCFPRLGVDWRATCLSTLRYRDVFNGSVHVSIVTGDGCEGRYAVAKWFKQFATLSEMTFVGNVPAAGLNTTFRDQLKAIRNESGIVFKGHTKGVSHATAATDPYKSWRDNMALGCLGDPDHVASVFSEGYRTFGTFKTFSAEGAAVMGQIAGPFRTRWPGWHYPGAMFWFRPCDIPDKFCERRSHYYENEAFPCHICPTELAYSLMPENLNFNVAGIEKYFGTLNKPITQP